MGIKIYNHKGEFGIDYEEESGVGLHGEDTEEHQTKEEVVKKLYEDIMEELEQEAEGDIEEAEKEIQQQVVHKAEEIAREGVGQKAVQELKAEAKAQQSSRPADKDKVNLKESHERIAQPDEGIPKDINGKDLGDHGKTGRRHAEIQRKRRTSRLEKTDYQSITVGQKRVDNIKFEMNGKGCFINGKPFDPKNPPQGLAIAVDQKTARS